jgi:hypothetical protein
MGGDTVVFELPLPACEVAATTVQFWVLVKSGALQFAVVPPPEPMHVQFHGPLPVTADAVPAEHRLVVGGLDVGTPFADPHAPFMAPEIIDTVPANACPSLVATATGETTVPGGDASEMLQGLACVQPDENDTIVGVCTACGTTVR